MLMFWITRSSGLVRTGSNMFKVLLGWLADICDLIGKLFENMAKYPGCGFLAPIGNRFSSYADAHAMYLQKLEWKKQGLLTSKDRVGELAGQFKPKKKGGAEPSADEVAASAAADAGQPTETGPDAAGVSVGSESGGSVQARSGQANLSGTIEFDSTVVDQAPPSVAMAGRDAGGPSRPRSDKPAYYGTLDGPGQSISGTVNLAPPDYAPSAPRGASAAPQQRPTPAMPAAVPTSDYDEPSAYSEPTAYGESRGMADPVGRRGTRSATVGHSARTCRRSREPVAPAPSAMTEEEAAVAWSLRQASASLVEEDQPTLLPVADREEQLARLDYFSYRLREAREPLCGLNGVLILMPLTMLREGTREHIELPRAIQGDLLTLQESLGLRFPTTTLLVGLEEHRGFEELVRRIGPQRAGSQRLGHRFDNRLAVIPTQLAALCVRLTGVFEDWVYAIFREHGSIARPGNSHLFGLLCQVRTDLQPRLLRILSGGFGRDREEAPGELPLGFSGCYFAATGRSEDRRAFVRGVFDKLLEEQSQVEWLPESRAAAKRYRRLGWLGLCVAAGFLGWLAYAMWIQP
jgi:hypothetical protein